MLLNYCYTTCTEDIEGLEFHKYWSKIRLLRLNKVKFIKVIKVIKVIRLLRLFRLNRLFGFCIIIVFETGNLKN